MKIKTLICSMMLILCTVFCVNAEETEYVVKFKEGYIPDVQKYGLTEVYAPKGIYTTYDIDALEEIKEYIRYTEENGEIFLDVPDVPEYPMLFANDEYYNEQWWLDTVRMEGAWRHGAYGEEIKVAVIDSGCNSHIDIQNNLLAGYNYSGGNTDVTDTETDSYGRVRHHGTHVCGIIGAEANNIGIKGIAPKVKIVPIKCFSPSTTYANIAKAIYEAVEKYGCRVVNMSWGATSSYTVIREAVEDALDLGAILVASVGNDSGTTKRYPAAYSGVIGVGAVNKSKGRPSFSNYNETVMIVAPGTDIKSLHSTNSYKLLSGTSQAAPIISGIAAAALSAKPDLTRDDFIDLLTSTAEDIGTAGYDTSYGYGLVNAEELMNKLLMDYYVSPISLVGGEASVTIKNNTDEPVTVVSLMAEYNDNVVVGAQRIQRTIPKGQETTVSIPVTSGEKISHFLWNENYKPISLKREKEVQ